MSFWSNKKVFVTGHTGFKGAWLVKMLIRRGSRVFGYALGQPSEPCIYGESEELKNIPQVIGDIRSGHELTSSLCAFKPDVVLHLAAQALVRDSYRDPVGTFETNVMGTVNLFEAVRKLGSDVSLVNVTSDKCYDNKEWIWGYRESEAMGGKDPYSASKGCSELVTSSYRHSYFKFGGVRLASARAGNVFGGGDWATDRLIPDIIRSFNQNQAVTIRSPQSIRPWQFVLEPISGYLRLAEKNYLEPGFDQGWNFGPSDVDTKSVMWMAKAVAKRWGKDATIRVDSSKDHPKEACLLRLDSTKARSILGWSPVLDLETSLDWTVDFYKNFYTGSMSIDALMNDQVEKYLDLVGKKNDSMSLL